MSPTDAEGGHSIHCRLDELLTERGLTLVQLSQMVGITVVNLSVLKNDRARSVRFSTLTAICEALECEVGDVLSLDPRQTATPN